MVLKILEKSKVDFTYSEITHQEINDENYSAVLYKDYFRTLQERGLKSLTNSGIENLLCTTSLCASE